MQGCPPILAECYGCLEPGNNYLTCWVGEEIRGTAAGTFKQPSKKVIMQKSCDLEAIFKHGKPKKCYGFSLCPSYPPCAHLMRGVSIFSI
jgi:hypothetical protein